MIQTKFIHSKFHLQAKTDVMHAMENERNTQYFKEHDEQ